MKKLSLEHALRIALTLGLAVVLAAGFAGGLLVCSVAHAGETWAVGSVSSYHLERRGQNERNWGLGFEAGIGAHTRAIGGAYRNSSDDTTVYAGLAHLPWQHGRLRLGGMLAAASGYEDKPAVLLAAVAALEGRRAGINLGFIPAAGGVFVLQVKWKLE